MLSQAIERGYRVTVLVRDKSRLPASLRDTVTVVEGDASDPAALNRCMTTGIDAVLSTLGVFIKEPGTPMADMTGPILAAMQDCSVKRLVCMSTLGVGESRLLGNLTVRFVTGYVLRHVLVDKQCQEKLIEFSNADWTILRPPRILPDERHSEYKRWQNYSDDIRPRWKISKSDAAKEMLDLLEDDSTIGQIWHLSY